MPVLAITVLGPFGYAESYPLSQFITVMAPMCSQHKGGMSGIGQDAEFQFQGNECNRGGSFTPCTGFTYQLGINPGNVANTSWVGAGSPVPVPVKTTSLDPCKWRFWVVLPKPDVLVSVNPIRAAISGIPGPPVPYTVAVRFIYNNWDGSDIPVLLNGQTGPRFVFKGTPLGEANRLDLELEYSGPVRDDLEHEDAVSCFETLMRTLGLDWTIGFPPPPAPLPAFMVTRRSDCHAAVAWMK